MRTTAIKKLLRRIRQQISPASQEQRAEISESRAVSDMKNSDNPTHMSMNRQTDLEVNRTGVADGTLSKDREPAAAKNNKAPNNLNSKNTDMYSKNGDTYSENDDSYSVNASGYSENQSDYSGSESGPSGNADGYSEGNATDGNPSDANYPTGEEEAGNGKSIVDRDISELKGEFDELSQIRSIGDLPNPTRYAALRDLGLTPREAYLATCRPKSDGRAHLTSSVPRAAMPPMDRMSKEALMEAREIFSDMDDTEIQRLYKKVTTN